MIEEVQDTVALRTLYEEHAPALYRLAVALVGDAAQAEDLVHDAFLRLHRVAQPPAAGAERAYLRRTVVNLAHDQHRRQAMARRRIAPAPYDQPSAEALATDAERDGVVAAAVAALPARQRDCVVLHYFAELSDSEIAAVLGISVGSVKTHLHRARAALARRLEDLR